MYTLPGPVLLLAPNRKCPITSPEHFIKWNYIESQEKILNVKTEHEMAEI